MCVCGDEVSGLESDFDSAIYFSVTFSDVLLTDPVL